MTPRVKAVSSESEQRPASRAGRFFGAFASRVADGVKGVGAGRSRRSRRGVAIIIALLALIVGFTTQLIPALASSPPSIGAELYEEAVGSTRAHIEVQLFAGGNNVEISWRGEYATSEALLNEGKGIVADSGHTSEHEGGNAGLFPDEARTSLGTEDAISSDSSANNTNNMLHHLQPSTMYYARFHVENVAKETVSRTFSFTTRPAAAPEIAHYTVEREGVTTFTGGSTFRFETTGRTGAFAKAQIESNGAQSEYTFEYAPAEGGHAPAEGSPSWAPFTSGAGGTVTVAEDYADPEAKLTGLAPETAYYARIKLHSELGSVVEHHTLESEEGLAETFSAKPSVGGAPGVSNVTSGSAYLTEQVVPRDAETQWQFESAESPGGPWTPISGAQGTITQAEAEALPEDANAPGIEGPIAGLKPASTYYVRLSAKNTFGEATSPVENFKTSGPPSASTLSVHGLDGEALRLLGAVNPEGYDTHYHFEYLPQKQFEAEGFAHAAVTPEVDVGAGRSPDYVGADLPSLTAGESYRFRIVATNTLPGNPVVRGEEQVLTVPPVPAPEAPGACPNEALRTGPSALLPDCRAYEQVTPAEKDATQELYAYGAHVGQEGAVVGEDGDHLEYGSEFVKFGDAVGSGQSPYFFTRTETGWRMTAGTPQPEAGIDRYEPVIFSPDLTEFGFESLFQTSATSKSPQVEFRAGPPGGPYATVATVTRKAAEGGGWVAASEDFSKLLLQLEDPTLLGTSTHTQSGDPDLYEYSAGELRQVNVTGTGATIGSCGATIARGAEGIANENGGRAGFPDGSRHAVSADGSQVFFEATPGSDCSQPKNLYDRVDGGGEHPETVDLGAYKFRAANAKGTTLWLVKDGGGEVLGYDTEKHAIITRSSTELATERELSLFGIADGVEPEGSDAFAHPRYTYFTGVVGGMPGGGQVLQTPNASTKGQSTQVYRYDREQALVQCVSCASSFDPEPRESAFFAAEGAEGANYTVQGMPRSTTASANGDYVFFDTAAALVPSDVDGEITPEINDEGVFGVNSSPNFSVSSDVYEWRRDGLNGCAHLQGCLALITTGGGGFMNVLIGTADEGRDVFFATKESLLPSDNDSAEDIYDARIDGGFAEPARPVECAGDACASPFAPPGEVTPSSSTFQGPGNPAPATAAPAVKKKAVAKKKPKKKAHKKKKVKKAKESAKGRK